MPDSLLPSLKEAFQHADDCYLDLEEVISALVEVQEVLPEQDSELQTTTTQLLDKAFAIQDSCHTLLKDLQDLRLKYRSVYVPTKISPEVDELVEVLARIEARRRGLKPEQE